MTYVEAEAMVPERGGSATFARHAFRNELVSFIAGWAILIDYVIVIALAALSVPHYLTPIWSGFTDTAGRDRHRRAGDRAARPCSPRRASPGAGRPRLLTAIALAGVTLLIAVIVVGALTVFDVSAITDQLDPFTTPTLDDVIYAGVIATVAFAGIEAAANLAPDIETGARRPAQAGGGRGGAGAGDLLRRLGDRADGGPGRARRPTGRRPRSAEHLPREPRARGGAELRARLGRRT